ncbi:MAG: hypothetical protein D6753_13270 [Planctomycetota bacterium]|nr:MAG: hypothetical protein D6753_13270 [Planctomycetota bacterium]
MQRRHLEMTQAFHEFRATVEAAMTEVEIKARDLETTFGEMVGRYMAMQAAREEAEFLLDRWRMLADENDAVVLLLEDLLDAQERLAEQESALAQAQSDYALAIVRLQQATGRLLQINRL